MHGSGVLTQANTIVYCGAAAATAATFAAAAAAAAATTAALSVHFNPLIRLQNASTGTWVEGVITGNSVKTTTSNSNKTVVLFENGTIPLTLPLQPEP